MRNCSVVICDRFTTWFEWQFWYSGRRGENVMQRLSFSSNKSCDFYKSCKTWLKTTQKCLIFQKCFLVTFGAMSTKGWRRGTPQHLAARTAQPFKTKTGRLFLTFEPLCLKKLIVGTAAFLIGCCLSLCALNLNSHVKFCFWMALQKVFQDLVLQKGLAVVASICIGKHCCISGSNWILPTI